MNQALERHKGLISCPGCGEMTDFGDTKKTEGQCNTCASQWCLQNHILRWLDRAPAQTKKPTTLLNKLKSQLHPLNSWLLPFRHMTHYRVERYYKRTLSDQRLAAKWQQHYFENIKLAKNELVLDHGCGRGRVVGLCNQLGLHTLGQELNSNPWWDKIPQSFFQVVPPHYAHLPWRTNTFGAVLDINVLHYMDETQLQNYAQEAMRVLKPGGYWVMLEANNKSLGAHFPRKQIGHLHDLSTVQEFAKNTGFKEVSLSYEGFYAPFLTFTINYFRHQFSFKQLDIADFDSYIERFTASEKRALWLLILQKPN